MGLIHIGGSIEVHIVGAPLGMAGGPAGAVIGQTLSALVESLLDLMVQLGVWLAYADAIANRRPASPAASWSAPAK